MKAVTAHAKGTGIVFAIDSNARSTTWHDVLTNKGGKKMEEFLISDQLHIANIESSYTTSQTCRGASNIDLTILNNTAIKYLQDWAVYDRESCSDHIIKYAPGEWSIPGGRIHNTRKRYIMTQKNTEKLQATVLQTMEQITRETGTIVKGEDMLDETWCQRMKRAPNIEAVVDELQDILEQVCRSSLTRTGRDGKALRHKPIPWWTSQLTTQRKEVNAKSRRYQRTNT